MPEPVSTAIGLGTLLKMAGVNIGVSAVGSWIDRISNRRQAELRSEVLQQNIQFTNDLSRRARGKFTSDEIQAIQQSNAPIVSQVQAGLTQRGLGGTPGTQAVVAGARHQPFATAQQQAMGGFPAALQALNAMLPKMGPGITPGLQAGMASILQSYVKLAGMPGGGDDDPVLDEVLFGQHAVDTSAIPGFGNVPMSTLGKSNVYQQAYPNSPLNPYAK